MYYGEIKNCDIANGEGVRVTLFVSGCTNRCKNCFQPQTWAFDYGQPFTAETEEALLQMLAPAYINGLTLLGGEPFEPENQRGLLPFLRRVRERLPGKTIWAFTGFTWEQLHTDGSHPRCEVTDALLALLDVLVWAVCRGTARHLPAFSRLEQSAYYQRNTNACRRQADTLGGLTQYGNDRNQKAQPQRNDPDARLPLCRRLRSVRLSGR